MNGRYWPSWIYFKNKEKKLDLFYIHWSLAMVLAAMSGFCKKNKIPFMVTDMISTKEEDMALGRVSSTHRTKRAADISVKGWSATDIEDFVRFWDGHEFNKNYGAVSRKTGKPRLVYYHDSGFGSHCHVQVKIQD